MATLKDEKTAVADQKTFDLLCVKYYEFSLKYCLNVADKNELKSAFESELGLDIDNLSETMSPLGFSFKFSDEMPKKEVSKEAEQALNDEETQEPHSKDQAL